MTAQTRHRLLFATLAVVLIAAFALLWPRSEGIASQSPAMSAEQIAATPDRSLVQTAATEIRWWLAADPSRQPRWRELGEPVRHILALSWVESGEAGSRNDPFRGFAALFASTSPTRPSTDDLARAYEAIGAPELAALCREVQRVTDQEMPPQTDPRAYEELNAAFRRARDDVDSHGKFRAYIRQHAAAIAMIRQH